MRVRLHRFLYYCICKVDIKVNGSFVDVLIPTENIAPYEHIVEVRAPLNNGEYITLTDYASAGKLWNEESVAVFFCIFFID